MVPGNLRVVRDARVAVVQASEDECIVLGEGEDFPDIFALADLELDFGAHGFGLELRRAGKIVNLRADYCTLFSRLGKRFCRAERFVSASLR